MPKESARAQHHKTLFALFEYFLHKLRKLGCCGGQVINMLAFYSDDLSSNPAQDYLLCKSLCLKRTKINKARVGPFYKSYEKIQILFTMVNV